MHTTSVNCGGGGYAVCRPNCSSVSAPDMGEHEQPHNQQVSSWHSDLRASRIAGTAGVAGLDGLGLQHCAGALGETRTWQDSSQVRMPDNRCTIAACGWGHCPLLRDICTGTVIEMRRRKLISPHLPRSMTGGWTVLTLISRGLHVTCTLL